MRVIPDAALQQTPEAARGILLRIAARRPDGRIALGGHVVGELGLGFAHRVAWLRRAGLLAGLSWQGCIAETGVRWLVLGDGAVLGAITLWKGKGSAGWAADWSGWATATPEAVRLAAAHEAAARQAAEPLLLRIKALGAAALWLRPHDGGPGLVLPLPPACAALPALASMPQDAYLAAAQGLMRGAAAATRGAGRR